MHSLSLFEYTIAVSFLVSLTVYYKPVKPYKYLQLFPPFLLATLTAELVGDYLGDVPGKNVPLYNFFSTFEFCFYLWIIGLVIKNVKWKRIIRASILFYAIIALVNIFFIQKMNRFHTFTYSIGCLLIVLFCVCYFLELFRLPRWDKLTSNPAFWICSGLLFFYCCGFPLYGLINYWGSLHQFRLVIKNFKSITSILNIFLYTLFTIAFLCSRTRKYTLSSS